MYGQSFFPKKFCLVKKENNTYHTQYEDIFTKSKYFLFGDAKCNTHDIVISNLDPVCTTKKKNKL